MQSDSIRANVFNQLLISFFFVCFNCPFTSYKQKNCVPQFFVLCLSSDGSRGGAGGGGAPLILDKKEEMTERFG